MDLKEKMEQFNKRWNIQDNIPYSEKSRKFKTGVLNIFQNIDSHLPEDQVSLFCRFLGISENWRQGMHGKYGNHVISALTEARGDIQLYRLLELVFALEIRTTRGYQGAGGYSKSKLHNQVIEVIIYSGVNLTTIAQDGEIIFYPKGEELLDNQVVNKVLSVLDEKSNSHFVDALKFYQAQNWVKSAESLRRTLEEYLRYKLGNNLGLEANIRELGKSLKQGSSDVQIRNIITTVFNYLDKYFNENSKHQDDVGKGEKENEFLIYQVGTLIRYVASVL